LITTLKAPVTGAISGGGSYEVPYGSWVSAAQNFTPEPSALGKSFYVLAYAEGLYDTPTFTLDEIYLGKDAPIAEPPFNVGAYTCYDLINNLGGTYPEGDMNEDCDVDLEDINLFITEWLAEVSL
jgi:hypothetical protein